jgi:hypothetical protein
MWNMYTNDNLWELYFDKYNPTLSSLNVRLAFISIIIIIITNQFLNGLVLYLCVYLIFISTNFVIRFSAVTFACK